LGIWSRREIGGDIIEEKSEYMQGVGPGLAIGCWEKTSTRMTMHIPKETKRTNERKQIFNVRGKEGPSRIPNL
jgi:hypothetical protein